MTTTTVRITFNPDARQCPCCGQPVRVAGDYEVIVQHGDRGIWGRATNRKDAALQAGQMIGRLA